MNVAFGESTVNFQRLNNTEYLTYLDNNDPFDPPEILSKKTSCNSCVSLDFSCISNSNEEVSRVLEKSSYNFLSDTCEICSITEIEETQQNTIQDFNLIIPPPNEPLTIQLYILHEVFSQEQLTDKNQHISISNSSPLILSGIEEGIFYDEIRSSPIYKNATKHQLTLTADSKSSHSNSGDFDFWEIQRDMPKLIYPIVNLDTQKDDKLNDKDQILNDKEEKLIEKVNKLNENEGKLIGIDEKLNDQSEKLNDQNSNKEKVTESSFSIPDQNKSKLFPTTQTVSSVPQEKDDRPTFIIDNGFLSSDIQTFLSVFNDCRVITRKLKFCDIEINDKTCILLREYDLDQISEILLRFETVYIIKWNRDIKSNKSGNEYGAYSELTQNVRANPLKVRYFLSQDAALIFIRSLVDKNQTFLKDCETLHEHLLSLFPTISKSLAQAILRKGNPIAKKEMNLIEYPQMNIFPFQFILDSPSHSFLANKAGKQKSKYFKEPNKPPTNSLARKKIKAPFPAPFVSSITDYF